MDKQVKLTHDGSFTLYVPELNETYHSVHGAIQEAKHVYIKKGLAFHPKKTNVNVLEIGFGTGLNATLSYLYSINSSRECFYTSIEKYPLSQNEIMSLNYPSLLNSASEWQQIHDVAWGEMHRLNPFFSLCKLQMDLTNQELIGNFDVVFFDAFAPEKQAEMWTDEVFLKIKKVMNSNGVLVTYCCKGVIKRRLQNLGFQVEKTDGPPGKREMLRAIKIKII